MATDKFTTERSDKASTLGVDAIPHTPADSDLPINVKAVKFSEATTITFKNAAGVARTSYPVAAGVLEFVPKRITAVAAGTCWLIV